MTNNKHKWGPLLYSGLGVAAMFLVLVAVAVIANFAKVRLDLTQDRLYTLSEGTRKILGQDRHPGGDPLLPHPGQHRRARDAQELRRSRGRPARGVPAGGGWPDRGQETRSPTRLRRAEDSARLDGVEGQAFGAGGLIGMGDKVYLGLSVTCLDEKVALPFLDPQRERLLSTISPAPSRTW